jgi:hypothetical protein
MNIRLGVYDLFSRIVPGGFYLLAFSEFARVLGWVQFDWKIMKDLGILLSAAFLIIAYVTAAAMDGLASIWQRIFKKPETRNAPFERVKQLHVDHWAIDFEDKDWPILRAYIYIHNPAVGEEIERFNALNIMFRNLSLGLVLLSVVEIIQFVNTNDWRILVLAATLLFFSYQLALRARNNRDWFYNYILEVIIAYRLNLEERVKPVKTSSKRKQ